MDLKNILAVIGILLSLIAPLPYIRDIANNKIKPHIVTWLIWSVLATAGCMIQLIGGGGLGSLVLGSTAFMNLIILGFCLKRPKDQVTRFDIFILVVAFLAVVAWQVTNSPELAAVLVTFAAGMGFIPTYRKSFVSPSDETASLYWISAIKQAIGIVALSAYNLLTLLFPVMLVFANLGLVLLIIVRRRKLAA